MASDRLGCADRFDELGDGVFGKVAGDVGFADYAQQPMIFDDGQPADLVFFHHAEHLFDAGPGPDMIGAALGELAGATCTDVDPDPDPGALARHTAAQPCSRRVVSTAPSASPR